ncbi:type II toxin-antitoxin system VapC family toxin [Gloeocapsopsis sp. IPPAS B-1203]|uniref:type II toxin-antitoxin system VapC family toxin n=1 Tax=Gloeocapsopsis sp. IPPAS B-1203 TaxID=2049454 RepID=UPI000C197740|nr:type II toxin-antitoxin system VapC family toxin [Gloeocapsopsis sp. IPPAS B-1203]PIG93418.1 PIN domain nuclease [Gloeocapsopsis sp. IPPAS B-1203]
MRLLLDTHTLIWIIFEPNSSSERVTSLFVDREHEIFLSIVSIWEMQIKLQLGKLNFDLPLSELIESQRQVNDLQLLSILTEHIYALEMLPNHHRPFDRLLIAQAIVEQMPLH